MLLTPTVALKLVRALQALRGCFNDQGELIIDPNRAQFDLVNNPKEATTILKAVDAALQAAGGR